MLPRGNDAEPLLPKASRYPQRASGNGGGGSRRARAAPSRISAWSCCCGGGVLAAATSYTAVSLQAGLAASALIAELQEPAPPASDPRTFDVLRRLWQCVFDDDEDAHLGDDDSGSAVYGGRRVPPVPSPRWNIIVFQGT